jgi:hypothetical protein
MDDFDFFKLSGANDKLRGVVVLVRPDLECDPLDKRNHVGVICEANLDLDNIYVDFKYNVGLFSADALFTFLPENKILEGLVSLSSAPKSAESLALRRVNVLVRFGGVTEKIKAMLTASDYPAIQPLCVEILQNQISREIPNQYGRD